ncbi:MAG: NAD+ synthase, partial [Nitrospiraceae bacterium]|nr:NAD+ synthase [Nitrospiraceae bacterium]
MNALRLALAQINPTVGDLAGNSAKILEYVRKAKRSRADIAVFPELALTGYPPEDLILKPQFIADNLEAMRKISLKVSGIVVIAGFVDRGKRNEIYNSAAVIADGRIVDVYHKIFLPNYGVFDEFRYFTPGRRFPVYRFGPVKFGINICEDVWHSDGPACIQSHAGAECIININASPYERGKPEAREKILSDRATENDVVIAYLNTVGGQDELVFDGMSMVVDHTGRVIARGSQFEEEMVVVDLDLGPVRRYRKEKGCRGKSSATPEGRAQKISLPSPEDVSRRQAPLAVAPRLKSAEEVYRALCAGTADYVKKNGFSGVVIGLSGGVDSSLVAAVAVDAIGKENVRGIFMPSRFTSEESREDAFGLAANLGMRITEVAIDSVFAEYLEVLSPLFRGREPDITEENLQARIRGNYLTALSNKFAWLVLTTGNKAEMSVGYGTLY